MQISDEMKALEALARAYDHEEAACMGEPSPWVSADSEGDDEWKAERIVAARAGLDAYRSALSLPVQPVAWATGAAKESGWTLDPKFLEKLSKDAQEATGYDATWEVIEHVYIAALTAPPVTPTKGPEDDLRAALEVATNALEGLSYIHDGNPSDAMADTPPLEYARHMLYEARQIAKEAVREVLALRSRPASALPVVKPLEWREVLAARSDEDPALEHIGDYEAETPFGCYCIGQYFGSDSYGWQVTFDFSIIADKDDPSDAKAAAQADYERRILSALSPSVQP